MYERRLLGLVGVTLEGYMPPPEAQGAAVVKTLLLTDHVSQVDGKIYCEYEAPNPEALREHARRAGIPCDRISEIGLEVSPDMFQ